MCLLRSQVDMGFTAELFPEGTHMCLIYDDDRERQEVISQFLASGISCGEQVAYLADTTTKEDVDDWLRGSGVNVVDGQRPDEFEVFRAVDVYCPSGRFDPREMVGRLGSFYDRAIAAAYPGARVSGEMSWALRGIPGSDRLMEYEALINTISRSQPITPICQYDSRRFDGATIFKVLKVHPLMIVRGRIVQNPYYLTPEEFFAEQGMAVDFN